MTESNKLIKWFKGVTVAAIIWNLLGVFSFFFHVYMPDESISKLPEAEQLLYKNIPTWKTIAFCIATVGGLIGSILLFLKQRFSITVLLFSLLGTLVSFYYDFFKTEFIDTYGYGSVFFPLLIVLIGIFLVWYAQQLEKVDIIS